MELPKLNDLISELHAVTEIFLRDMESIFDPWYELRKNSCEVDTEASKKLFDRKREQLIAELKGDGEIGEDFMPAMKQNAPRDTAEHEAIGGMGCMYFRGGKERKLDSKCFLQAPIWCGDRITIRWSAKVVGPTLLESRVFINTSSVVKRSVICAGSQIDELAVLSDSIIGRDVYVEPGAKILHRHGRKCREIEIRDFREMTPQFIRTGRHKLGAVIGDGCRIGANAVIMPGTILLPGCEVEPGRVLQPGIYTPRELNISRGNTAPRSTLRSLPNCS